MEFVKELNYPPNFEEFKDYFEENKPKDDMEESSNGQDSFDALPSNSEVERER